MARTPRNELQERPLSNGSTLLFGRVLGKKIRRRFRSPADLVQARAEYELKVLAHNKATAGAPTLKLTHLTPEQLRDAEAAVHIAGGRRLVECVAAAQRVLPPVDAISCEFALTEWLATLKKRKRSTRTTEKNESRIKGFLAFAKVKNLVEITPAMIERWIDRESLEDAGDFTRLTDAQVLRAWLNFCMARSRRWLLVSPFDIDMKDRSATAKPKAPGRILSPEQAHAYLKAAREYRDGLLAPYVILTTWLFLRESEARAVTKGAMRLEAAVPIVRVESKKRGTVKHRTVAVPANVLPILRAAVKDWKDTTAVPFSRSSWTTVRDLAGLLTRGKLTRNKRRPILSSKWQADIGRHTGISYLYQQTGDIKEVCRQAGNTSDVSFRHYLTLPEEGAAKKFYAAVQGVGSNVTGDHP